MSASLSGGDLFKLLKDIAMGPGFNSGLELSLLPPSFRSCIDGGRIGFGVLGWSQSELGFEFDLDGELLMVWFLCVRACCFILP